VFLLMAQVFFSVDASRDMFDVAARFSVTGAAASPTPRLRDARGLGRFNGSSLATAATIGSVALPEMRRRGYSDSLGHRHRSRQGARWDR
jgi:TRAP-type C4-dicarboxylate transport system permease large subunit